MKTPACLLLLLLTGNQLALTAAESCCNHFKLSGFPQQGINGNWYDTYGLTNDANYYFVKEDGRWKIKDYMLMDHDYITASESDIACAEDLDGVVFTRAKEP